MFTFDPAPVYGYTKDGKVKRKPGRKTNKYRRERHRRICREVWANFVRFCEGK